MSLVPTVAAAVQLPALGVCSSGNSSGSGLGGGLEVLQIRNMERRGIVLRLNGLEVRWVEFQLIELGCTAFFCPWQSVPARLGSLLSFMTPFLLHCSLTLQ